MKTMRNLFLLCAGLSLFACSSDDDATQQFPEGNGMVEVKVINPMSARANGDKINIEGTITITLTHANGTLTQTVEVGEGTAARNQTVKFWNVVNPSKVTATINDGVADYSATEISTQTLQVEPKSIPAYGETTTFTKEGTLQPEGTENANSGYKTGDAEKEFTRYVAGITMAIPVARLEVGAIGHTSDEGNCTFSELTLTGVYLDDIYVNGGTYSNGAFTTPSAENDNLKNYNGYTNAILKNEGNGASAFNFYGGGKPIFKVYFESAKFAEGAEAGEEREGWAMITKYKMTGGEEITSFENGKIYQVADVTLLDNYIVGDEENSALYAVEVTVTEAVWEVVTTDVEWAE